MKKKLLLITFTLFYYCTVFSQTLYTSTVQAGTRFNAGIGSLGTPIILFDDVLIPSTLVQGTDSIRITKAKFGIRRLAGAPAVTVKFYYTVLDDTASLVIGDNLISIPPVLIGSVNLPASAGSTTTIVPLGDSLNTLFAVKTDTGNAVPGYQTLFVGISFSNYSGVTDLNGWRMTTPGSSQSNNADAYWRYNADSSKSRFVSTFNGTPPATFYLQLFATTLNPVPVSLSDFTAQRTNSGNLLHWSTQQELGTTYFLAERSTDGKNFSPIGQVAAAGNSNTILHYTFKDIHPSKGNNYYRLRSFDKDNTFKLSDTRRIRNEGIADISVYPNPVKDRFTVSINADKATTGQLSITDISGKTVYTRSLKLAQGNTILPVGLNNVSAGAYILKIQLNDDLIIQKITKQ
ncbi:MAG: T9SS type A sorting domain-containing protein [Ferruginibacter sp.]